MISMSLWIAIKLCAYVQVAEQELLIEPFREQLEQYEIEKSTLLDQKCDAENEIKSLSLKYAEMLGHQNHKQKIKYMVDLKAKNLQLKDVGSSAI